MRRPICPQENLSTLSNERVEIKVLVSFLCLMMALKSMHIELVCVKHKRKNDGKQCRYYNIERNGKREGRFVRVAISMWISSD